MTVSTSACVTLTCGMIVAFLLGYGGGIVSKFDPIKAIKADVPACVNLTIQAPGLTLHAPNGQQIAEVGE